MKYVIATLVIIAIIAVAFSRSRERTKKTVSAPKAQSVCDAPSSVKIDAQFAYSQLIGGERFLSAYHDELTALYRSAPFQAYINKLRKELNGLELSDTKAANKAIADSFFFTKANENYPPVAAIVAGVRRYGKQASAHISIYYAMYILDADGLT